MTTEAVKMSMLDVSRFTFENWSQEMNPGELNTMSDQELFALQSRMSIAYMQQYRKQIGFGSITVDAHPHDQYSELHLVPYRDMRVDPERGYIAKRPIDHATLILMATADMQELLDYYAKPTVERPSAIQVVTYHQLAETIKPLGFEIVPRYYLEDPDPTKCQLRVSTATLQQSRQLLEKQHEKATEQLQKYNITLRSARIDAIVRNSKKDYK